VGDGREAGFANNNAAIIDKRLVAHGQRRAGDVRVGGLEGSHQGHIWTDAKGIARNVKLHRNVGVSFFRQFI
jgi:hypothetical protein